MWVADITYVPTGAGFLYLAVVVDVFSRRVVGWAMESHIRTELVLKALNMALYLRRPQGVIHHSDQGMQYTAYAFGKRCSEWGVRPSMGSVGDCYDNALCESFFASLECELLDRRSFQTHAEARMAVFHYIEGWYNTHRRHSSIGYYAPIAFERRYTSSIQQVETPTVHQIGATPDVGLAITLLDLRRRDPETANAIEALDWINDGIGRPPYESISLANADPSEFEQSILLDLIELATSSRRALFALVSKPWIHDSLTAAEIEVIFELLDLSGWSEETAVRILEMPFLETIERNDDWIMEMLTTLRWNDPGILNDLLTHPELASGITDDHGFTISRISLGIIYSTPSAQRHFHAKTPLT